MKNLIDALATAVNTKPELETIRSNLFRVLALTGEDSDITELVLGIGSQYLKISKTDFEIISGSSRITAGQLAKTLNFAEDLRSRFLLPHTQGTDDIFDPDPFSSYEPVEQYEDKGIVGGSLLITDDDPRLTDARSPLPHRHPASEIDGLPQTANVYTGSSVPASPANGDLWFEPGSFYPQPWRYSTADTLWLSNTLLYDFGTSNSTLAAGASGSGINKPVPFYGVTPNRIKIEHLFGLLNTEASATAHTATDYYTFRIRRFRGTDTNPVDLYNLTTNSQNMTLTGATRFRRITETPSNLWLEGNTWFMNFYAVRQGTSASSFTVAANLMAYLRFARP